MCTARWCTDDDNGFANLNIGNPFGKHATKLLKWRNAIGLKFWNGIRGLTVRGTHFDGANIFQVA